MPTQVSEEARAGNVFAAHALFGMERIYLIVACASIVLLTTALGVASPPSNGRSHPQELPLLLRAIPR